MFPSPLGEVGSLILFKEELKALFIKFPSPLGEVGSLISGKQGYVGLVNGFRPLSGK